MIFRLEAVEHSASTRTSSTVSTTVIYWTGQSLPIHLSCLVSNSNVDIRHNVNNV